MEQLCHSFLFLLPSFHSATVKNWSQPFWILALTFIFGIWLTKTVNTVLTPWQRVRRNNIVLHNDKQTRSRHEQDKVSVTLLGCSVGCIVKMMRISMYTTSILFKVTYCWSHSILWKFSQDGWYMKWEIRITFFKWSCPVLYGA